nr:hypothetical protein CoNPh37_CDS0197 [Staphylococcus phage S-CoN_Ph37]
MLQKKMVPNFTIMFFNIVSSSISISSCIIKCRPSI